MKQRLHLVLSLVLVCLVAGCAVPLESARRDGVLGAHPSSPDRCENLDNARTVWGAVAKGAAVAAGASGVAAIPLEDQEARIAAASVAAGAAVVGAVAVYVSESKDEAWARECAAR